MTPEQNFYLGGVVFGALGGCLTQFIIPMAKRNGPARIRSFTMKEQTERIVWFGAKLLVSIIVTLIVTSWFMDDAVLGRLTHNKMFFVQIVSGTAPYPVLAAAQKWLF